MLVLMAHSVLWTVMRDIQCSPFLAVMVDETMDCSNTEQLTLIIRWFAKDPTTTTKMDSLDMKFLVNAYVDKNDARRSTFAKF